MIVVCKKLILNFYHLADVSIEMNEEDSYIKEI